MGRESNEGRACDAAMRILEQRSGALRGAIRHPEKEGYEPPVELRVPIGAVEYALEHTLVEAFPDEIANYYNATEPISSHLKERFPEGLLPPGYYWLLVPCDAKLPSGKARGKVLDSLGDWIETAPRMPGEVQVSPHLADLQVRCRVTLGCEVELKRWPNARVQGREPGRLDVVRSVPPELEERSRQRLETAISRKCPKLEKARQAWGVRTVLVLESDDMALTHPPDVADRVAGIAASRNDAPDEIFLVASGTDPWWVWSVESGGNHWSNVETFCRNDLVNAT